MEPDHQRLDKWLVVARFARTRSAAQRIVAAGLVRIGSRRITAPDHRVRIGDVLTVALAHATLVVEICGLSDSRGPPAVAQALYRDASGG